MPIALVLTLFLGGGVAYGAENSLPGDVLYPIKVGVNEKAKIVLAFSDEAKARVEAELAVRRLEEAEELAVSGRLDEKVQSEIEKRFEKHSKSAEARIAAMEKGNKLAAALDVSSDLESSVRTHGLVLKGIIKNKAEASARVSDDVDTKAVIALSAEASGDFGTRIVDGVDAMLESRNKVEARASAGSAIGFETSLKARTESLKKRLSELESYINSKKDKIGAEVAAEAEARVSLIKTLMAELEAKIEAEAEHSDILETISKIQSTIVETRIMVDISHRLDVEVGFNGGGGKIETDMDSKLDSKSRVDVKKDVIRIKIPSIRNIKIDGDADNHSDEFDNKLEIDVRGEMKTEPLRVESGNKVNVKNKSLVNFGGSIDSSLEIGD